MAMQSGIEAGRAIHAGLERGDLSRRSFAGFEHTAPQALRPLPALRVRLLRPRLPRPLLLAHAALRDLRGRAVGPGRQLEAVYPARACDCGRSSCWSRSSGASRSRRARRGLRKSGDGGLAARPLRGHDAGARAMPPRRDGEGHALGAPLPAAARSAGVPRPRRPRNATRAAPGPRT